MTDTPQGGLPILPRAKLIALAAIAMTALAALPAGAATLEQLESMSDLSQDEQSGIAAAQAQQARGEWLEALGTLERVLADNPKSAAARLLHALYLCKVDDRLGGQVELEELRAKDYPEGTYNQVRAECGLAAED